MKLRIRNSLNAKARLLAALLGATVVASVSATVASSATDTVGHSTAHAALQRLLTRTVLPEATSIFSADASAQTVGGRQAPSANTTGAATKQLAALEGRDHAAAQFTAGYGFSWDSSSTDVSVANVISETAASIEVVVNVENHFHIAGTPNDGALAHESMTVDKYLVDLARDATGWKVQSFALQPLASDTNGLPPVGGAVPPPASKTPVQRTTAGRNSTHRQDSGTYSPSAAYNYAAAWWNGYNPNYTSYSNDCQNFVSQVINAGGVGIVYASWRPGIGTWYNVSYFQSWAYTSGPFTWPNDVYNMVKGDVFEIAWYGGSTPTHTEFVDAVSGGDPLMAAHTNARWNYPLTTILVDYPSSSVWALHPYGAYR